VRVTLGLALSLPFVVFALPRVAPASWRTQPSATSPSVKLESVWRHFEAEHDVHSASIDDLLGWLEGERGLEVMDDLDVRDRWRIERSGDEVRIGLMESEAPAESADWQLEVRRAPWSGVDATLAASDLACVLCHVHVEGERPVRVLSATPFEQGVGADVHVAGTFEAAPNRLLAPDLVGALDTASFDPGFVASSIGGAGITAAAAVAGTAFESVHIDGEATGPVVLFGAPDQPIRISGDCVINGDLVLSGSIVGDGSLRVFGNVFIPGDLTHSGTGGLRLLVRGSVLVGEVHRPRRGEALPVTGGVDGSFGFLVESLARFNGSIASGAVPGALFSVRPQQPAPVLRAGARSIGSWRDPSLDLIADQPTRAVGPGPLAAGQSGLWISEDRLWASTEPGVRGVIGDRAAGTRLEALFIVDGAFIAVAAGIDSWRATGGTVGGALSSEAWSSEGSGPPPGALELHGALVATHAAIHAPAGLKIVDDPRARAAVRLPAVRGLVARLSGPSSSEALEVGSTVRVLSLEGARGPVRLLRDTEPDTETPR